jgi:hypothetical protein
MKNAKAQLKNSISKTANYILNVEGNHSARIPEWFEQMALSSSHDGLNNSLYENLLIKLKKHLNKEYGESVSNYLMSA